MDDVLPKLMSFCAYQERCHKEVNEKLKQFDLEEEDKEDLITYLEEEGFLDEDRFARAFAGGKFRVKKWGRKKIQQELWRKGVDKPTIAAAFRSEIPEKAYRETVVHWIEKKSKGLKGKSAYDKKGKLSRFLLQKGFEWEVIMEVLKDEGW